MSVLLHLFFVVGFFYGGAYYSILPRRKKNYIYIYIKVIENSQNSFSSFNLNICIIVEWNSTKEQHNLSNKIIN